MAPPRSTRPRGSDRWSRLGVLAAALPLAAALLVSSAPPLHDGGAASDPSTVRGRAVPVVVPAQDGAERSRAVEQLLQARAAAVLRRDRQAFLASVDPRATALVARQAAAFDALAQVPLGTWDYVLDARAPSAPDAELDRRYGAGAWWAPGVTLRHALAGFDPRPVLVDQHLTFARHDGRWLLAADDDFALRGRATPRALWDRGPVTAVRAGGVLVLGHPAQAALMRDVAALAARAVPRVTRAWGAWDERVVVVVPADGRELAGLLGSAGDLSRIAAVATAELPGGADAPDPTGQRVLVNPDTFAGLGSTGRRVVMTHELTHVATSRTSGPALPAWLAEGLADVVGHSGLNLPMSVVARDLRREVRAGRTPATLPVSADFEGGSARLSESYQGSWLAVRLLLDRYGRPEVLRLYREVGQRRGVSSEQALEDGLRSLGTSTAAFTADWRAAMSRQLG